jgi:eukaryotic-like serine/threonine-protein kinase
MATVGDRIDKFTLVRQLGAGGMGATWEAVRQVGRDFEQRVAIKLAEPELLRTSDGLASFRREAALAASLRHPNIAAVLDVDEQAGYIVCELVDGADLRGVMRAVPGGRIEPAVTVHIVGQIARGLNHAHRRILRGRPSPVIHRDMSPGNVVVDYDGNVKIVDFGIAKVLAVTGAEIAESVKGKLSYMAPEQAMGSRMDGRVDQYSLGVIAYEALSGVRPNDGAHEGETLACILEGRHMPLQERVPSLPLGLCRMVERMLALRPTDRFENMDGMLDALAEFTPKLTVHRSLIPLVMAARQPHTILSENGRFVSRPVTAVASAPSSLSATQVADAMPQQFRVSITPIAPHTPPRRPQHIASLAVTLGNSQVSHHEQGKVQEAAAPKSFPPPLPVPPAPPVVLPEAPAAPESVETSAPAARRGRVFGTLTLLASASLLALAAWLAFFPQLYPSAREVLLARLQQLSLLVAGRATEDSALAAVSQPQLVRPAPAPAPSSERAEAAPSPELDEPVAEDELMPHALADATELPSGTDEPEPANAAAASEARVRVRVLPGGKVWLDEQPTGDATPELELTVTPGNHVIAAGDERGPLQRRNVQISAEKLNIVRFELERP